MTPHGRLTASLLIALVISSPALLSALHGEADATSGVLRYLTAFVLVRLALGALAQLINSYRTSSTTEELPATSSDRDQQR